MWTHTPTGCIYVSKIEQNETAGNLHKSSSQVTYVSKTSVEEFLTCISSHLDEKVLEKLAATGKFTLLSDEATGKGDMAKLSILIHFADLNSNKVTQKFLAVVAVEESKEAKALFLKI